MRSPRCSNRLKLQSHVDPAAAEHRRPDRRPRPRLKRPHGSPLSATTKAPHRVRGLRRFRADHLRNRPARSSRRRSVRWQAEHDSESDALRTDEPVSRRQDPTRQDPTRQYPDGSIPTAVSRRQYPEAVPTRQCPTRQGPTRQCPTKQDPPRVSTVQGRRGHASSGLGGVRRLHWPRRVPAGSADEFHPHALGIPEGVEGHAGNRST